MQFDLNEEQKALAAAARKLAKEKIAPGAIQREFDGKFPWDMVKLLRENDIFGIGIPKEYEGHGGGLLELCVIQEEIAKVCTNTLLAFNLSAMFAAPILHFGTNEQKSKYIPTVARGEKFGCFGLSEPGAGSDAGGMQSRAVRNGDHYILNGDKAFISNFLCSNLMVLWAKTAVNVPPSQGITTFIVEKNREADTPGIINVKAMPKWSMIPIATCEFTMQDLKVPAENMLGKEGEGLKIALTSMNLGRISLSSVSVGIAQGAIDECVEYAKTRKAFGQSIGAFQGISFKLAEMQTKVAAARQLMYMAAALSDAGDPQVQMYGAMAKVFACDTAEEVAIEGAEILGGIGFMRNTSMCRRMLDIKGFQIAEGSQEIQRLIISRQMLGRL